MQTPFANRVPSGDSFHYVTRCDGHGFHRTSPFALMRVFKRLLQEHDLAPDNIRRIKRVMSGALLVHVENERTANAVLSMTSFEGKEVTCEPADNLNSTEALAHAPALADVPDDEILDELGSQGVIGVRRLRPSNGKPSPLIRLRFLGHGFPESIIAGYEVLDLRLFVRPPLQCRSCARWGHGTRSCKSKNKLCLKCSGEHCVKDCEEDELHCPYCEGPHAGWSRECPAVQEQLWRADEEQRSKITEPEPLENSNRPTYADAVVNKRRRPKTKTASTQTLPPAVGQPARSPPTPPPRAATQQARSPTSPDAEQAPPPAGQAPPSPPPTQQVLPPQSPPQPTSDEVYTVRDQAEEEDQAEASRPVSGSYEEEEEEMSDYTTTAPETSDAETVTPSPSAAETSPEPEPDHRVKLTARRRHRTGSADSPRSRTRPTTRASSKCGFSWAVQRE